MSEDIKRNMDVMRATAQVLEILLPFNPDDRMKIISGAVIFGNCGHVMTAEVREMPDISELLEKVKPRPKG